MPYASGMAKEVSATPDLASLQPADRFRVWLALNGLKQQDAAERLRVSDSHLSYVLRGRRGVNAELSRAISQMTGGFVVFAPTGEVGQQFVNQNVETGKSAARRGRKVAA